MPPMKASIRSGCQLVTSLSLHNHEYPHNITQPPTPWFCREGGCQQTHVASRSTLTIKKCYDSPIPSTRRRVLSCPWVPGEGKIPSPNRSELALVFSRGRPPGDRGVGCSDLVRKGERAFQRVHPFIFPPQGAPTSPEEDWLTSTLRCILKA